MFSRLVASRRPLHEYCFKTSVWRQNMSLSKASKSPAASMRTPRTTQYTQYFRTQLGEEESRRIQLLNPTLHRRSFYRYVLLQRTETRSEPFVKFKNSFISPTYDPNKFLKVFLKENAFFTEFSHVRLW